jgi:hypothetical protein
MRVITSRWAIAGVLAIIFGASTQAQDLQQKLAAAKESAALDQQALRAPRSARSLVRQDLAARRD